MQLKHALFGDILKFVFIPFDQPQNNREIFVIQIRSSKF